MEITERFEEVVCPVDDGGTVQLATVPPGVGHHGIQITAGYEVHDQARDPIVHDDVRHAGNSRMIEPNKYRCLALEGIDHRLAAPDPGEEHFHGARPVSEASVVGQVNRSGPARAGGPRDTVSSRDQGSGGKLVPNARRRV
jgi:hypothetical protein